ncbi:MAG: hypothetical protein ACHQM6_10910 [Candidatus Kapaibacterium sp.]
MDRDNLRTVIVLEPGAMPPSKTGYFHRWGEEIVHTDHDPFAATKGMIEMEDGQMRMVEVARIKFTS